MKKPEAPLRFRLLLKRMRDRKLKTKIRGSMLLIAFLSILGIGFCSYSIARSVLMDNTRQSVRGMIKQNGRALEDRISVYEESTYRIMREVPLAALFDMTREEAEAKKTRNEGMPAAIASERTLSEYTKYALLQPNSGVIYDYYRDASDRVNETAEEKLIGQFTDSVSRTHPVMWKRVDEDVYLIRLVVNTRLEEEGIAVFCLDPGFFNIISDDISYMSNDNVIIEDGDGVLLKSPDGGVTEAVLSETRAEQAKPDRYIYSMTRELGQDTCYITVVNLSRSQWSMITWFSYDVLLRGINRIFLAMLEALLAAGVAAVLLAMQISRSITRNVTVIENGMKEYEGGNFRYRMHPASYDEVGLISLQMNHMALEISDLMDKLHLKEEERRKLEIATLQAQINPHFLYNTLGSIRWEAYRDGQMEVAASLEALVKLLRFTIKRAGGMVKLSEEIEYIKNYIVIEKNRYGDRFDVEYDLEDGVLDLEVPGFILQPMVENSLLHGLDMNKDDGLIFISANLREDHDRICLVISEEDNGIGMDPEDAAQLLRGKEEPKYTGFSSIGMKIVDRRLKEIYGEEYHTDIYTGVGEGMRIELWIPEEGSTWSGR